MVQKMDKGNKGPKQSIATPSNATDKNQSQQLDKQSSNKTGKNSNQRNDPSGLPKYR